MCVCVWNISSSPQFPPLCEMQGKEWLFKTMSRNEIRLVEGDVKEASPKGSDNSAEEKKRD